MELTAGEGAGDAGMALESAGGLWAFRILEEWDSVPSFKGFLIGEPEASDFFGTGAAVGTGVNDA